MSHFKAKMHQILFPVRVAATSTRRDGGDRGGRCWCAEAVRVSLSVCPFVRPSLGWSCALTACLFHHTHRFSERGSSDVASLARRPSL